MCPFCIKKIAWTNITLHFTRFFLITYSFLFSFRSSCGYKHFYNKDSNWSVAFDACINNLSTQKQTEPLLNLLKEEKGPYKVFIFYFLVFTFVVQLYVVRSGAKLENLVYVGITCDGTTIHTRFNHHLRVFFIYAFIFLCFYFQEGTFKKYEKLWRTIFINNLTKKNAEILESLLILCCKLNTKMTNKQLENRNLQQFNNDKEVFHERVCY